MWYPTVSQQSTLMSEHETSKLQPTQWALKASLLWASNTRFTAPLLRHLCASQLETKSDSCWKDSSQDEVKVKTFAACWTKTLSGLLAKVFATQQNDWDLSSSRFLAGNDNKRYSSVSQVAILVMQDCSKIFIKLLWNRSVCCWVLKKQTPS